MTTYNLQLILSLICIFNIFSITLSLNIQQYNK